MAGNSPVSPGRDRMGLCAELLPSSDWEWINKAARFILGDDKVVPIISSCIGNSSSPYSLLSASPKMFKQLEQLLKGGTQGSFMLFLRNFSSDCQRCLQMTNSLIITMDITACLVFSFTWKRAIIFCRMFTLQGPNTSSCCIFFLIWLRNWVFDQVFFIFLNYLSITV